MRETLVMLPDLASDGALFAAQVRDLADTTDVMIGDTLSDDSLPAMATRVLAAAPERFALAGLSMGGYLAFEIMRQAPERVTRLALLDTSARADTPEASQAREESIAATAKYSYDKLTRSGLARLMGPDANPDVPRIALEMAVRTGVEVFVRQQRAIMARPDSRPLLPTIAVPTLVLVGAEDGVTPPALAREMADAIPGAMLVEVPDCGHLSSLEQPDAVTAALREWLAA